MTGPTTPESTRYEVIQGYLKTMDGSPGCTGCSIPKAGFFTSARPAICRRVSAIMPARRAIRARIARMISRPASMMFLTTRTETEALLLEQNLIKQLKPKFNVLLRDDKSFPNILVTPDTIIPQIKNIAARKRKKAPIMAPLPVAGAVNRTLNQLQRGFCCAIARMRCLKAARARVCNIQIKRCSAPCVGKITPETTQTVRMRRSS